MESTARLTLELDSNPLKRGAAEGGQAVDSLAKKSTILGSAMRQAMDLIRSGLGAIGLGFGLWKIQQQIRDAIQLGARYETLGIVMNSVGTNAGYTSRKVNELAKELERTGITMLQSRQTVISMIQSNLDLAHAVDLARVAQSAAVTAGLNSSETLQRIIRGVQSSEVEILRTVGLNVSWEKSYRELAVTLHKQVSALTEQEKAQARVNAVLTAGKPIASAYEAAMGTAGKQLQSSKRYVEDLKVELATLFLPAYTAGVFAYSDALKLLQHNVDTVATALVALGAVAAGRLLAPLVSNVLQGVGRLREYVVGLGMAREATLANVVADRAKAASALEAALATEKAAQEAVRLAVAEAAATGSTGTLTLALEFLYIAENEVSVTGQRLAAVNTQVAATQAASTVSALALAAANKVVAATWGLVGGSAGLALAAMAGIAFLWMQQANDTAKATDKFRDELKRLDDEAQRAAEGLGLLSTATLNLLKDDGEKELSIRGKIADARKELERLKDELRKGEPATKASGFFGRMVLDLDYVRALSKANEEYEKTDNLESYRQALVRISQSFPKYDSQTSALLRAAQVTRLQSEEVAQLEQQYQQFQPDLAKMVDITQKLTADFGLLGGAARQAAADTIEVNQAFADFYKKQAQDRKDTDQLTAAFRTGVKARVEAVQDEQRALDVANRAWQEYREKQSRVGQTVKSEDIRDALNSVEGALAGEKMLAGQYLNTARESIDATRTQAKVQETYQETLSKTEARLKALRDLIKEGLPERRQDTSRQRADLEATTEATRKLTEATRAMATAELDLVTPKARWAQEWIAPVEDATEVRRRFTAEVVESARALNTVTRQQTIDAGVRALGLDREALAAFKARKEYKTFTDELGRQYDEDLAKSSEDRVTAMDQQIAATQKMITAVRQGPDAVKRLAESEERLAQIQQAIAGAAPGQVAALMARVDAQREANQTLAATHVTGALREQIQAIRARLAATKGGEQALKEYLIQQEIDTELSKLDTTEKVRQREAIERLVRARAAEREELQKAEEAGKRAEEHTKQVYENLVRNVQGAFAGLFEGIFTEGRNAAQQFFDDLKRLFFKVIAEMLAAKVMQQLKDVLSGVLKTPSKDPLAGRSIETIYGTIGDASSTPAPGPSMGAKGMGALGAVVGGGMAGYQVGLGTKTAWKGAAGGALAGAATGAMIGSAVLPGIGTAVGAVLGGVAGLVGGLMGSSKAAHEAAKAAADAAKKFKEARDQFMDIAYGRNSQMGDAYAANKQRVTELLNQVRDNQVKDVEELIEYAGGSYEFAHAKLEDVKRIIDRYNSEHKSFNGKDARRGVDAYNQMQEFIAAEDAMKGRMGEEFLSGLNQQLRALRLDDYANTLENLKRQFDDNIKSAHVLGKEFDPKVIEAVAKATELYNLQLAEAAKKEQERLTVLQRNRADLEADLSIRLLAAQGRTREAEALGQQVEQQNALLDLMKKLTELNIPLDQQIVLLGKLAQAQTLENAEYQRQVAEQALQNRQGLEQRLLLAHGLEVEAATIDRRLSMQRELDAAVREWGTYQPELVALLRQVQAAEEERYQFLLAQAKTDFSDDLRVRALVAQSQDKEAARLRLQIQQAKELEEATKRWAASNPELIDQLKQVQALERAKAEQELATAQLNLPSGYHLAVREYDATKPAAVTPTPTPLSSDRAPVATAPAPQPVAPVISMAGANIALTLKVEGDVVPDPKALAQQVLDELRTLALNLTGDATNVAEVLK